MAAIEPVQLAASILSADFCRLGEQVEEAMKAGIRLIHVDPARNITDFVQADADG
jgi:pentose-5-phosphate-3-epimerase